MSEQGASEGCEVPNDLKGRYVPWSPEEDEQLRKLVEEHGARHWTTLAQFMPNRNSKSCRLRWVNQLRGDLKRTGFTPEEDEVIIRGHLKHGNKWTVIARDLPGRTDNAVKNRWHSTLRKRVQQQAELRQQLVSAAGIAEMANQPEAAQLLTNLASNLDQNPQEAAQLQALLASMSGATPTGRSTSSVAVSETAMDELLGTLAARAGLDPATCSTASSVARPPPQLMSQLQGVLQQAGMLLPGGQQHATSAAADASMVAPPTAAPMHGCAPSTTDLVMPSTSPLAITFGCDSGLAADAGAIAAAASVGSIGRADSSGPHQHFAGRRHVEAELPQAGSMPPPQRHGSRHAPKRHGSSGSTTTGPQNPSTLAPRDADVAADAAAATVGPEAPTAGPTGVAALLHSLTPEQLMWMAYMKKTQGQGMPPLAGPSMAPATSLHPSLCNPVCAPQPAAAEAPQAAPLERQRKRGLSSAAASERAGSSGVATGSVSEAPKRPRMERVASDVFMHEPCMASATQSVATLQGGMGGPDAALPVGLAVMELQQQQQLVQMQVMGMLGGMPGMPAAGLLAPLAAPLPPMAPQLAALAQEGMAPAGGVGLQALMQTNMSMQTNTSMQTNMLAQLASVGLQALMAAQQQSQQSQQQQAMAAQQQVMQANMLQHYLQRVADQQAHAPAPRRATKRTRATVTEPPAVATMAAAEPAASAAGGAPTAMAAAADADALGGLGGMELPSDQQLAQLCWDMDTTEFLGFNTPLGSLSDLTALLPADKATAAAPMDFETVADRQPKAAGGTPGLPQLLFHAAPAAPATAPAAPATVAAPEAAAARSSSCGYAAPCFQELGGAPMAILAPPPPPLFPACPQLGQLPPALAALAPMLPPTAPAPAPPPPAPTAAADAQPPARLQRRGSAGAAAAAAAARAAAPAAAAPAAPASAAEPAAAAPALPSHRNFDFWLPGDVPFTAATAFMMGTVTPASSSSTATSCPPLLDPPAAFKSQAPARAKAKAPGGNPPADAAFSFAPGLGSCKPPAAPKLAAAAAVGPPQPLAGHISSSRSYPIAGAPFPCGTMASLLMGRGFGRGKGPMEGSRGPAAGSTSSCSSGGGVEEEEEVPDWLAKAACPEPLGLGSMFEPLMMNNVVATAALSAAD